MIHLTLRRGWQEDGPRPHHHQRAQPAHRAGGGASHRIMVHLYTTAAAALHSFPHSLLTVHLYTTAAAAALLAAAVCDWTFRCVAFCFDEVLRVLYPTWKTLLRARRSGTGVVHPGPAGGSTTTTPRTASCRTWGWSRTCCPTRCWTRSWVSSPATRTAWTSA